MPAIGPERLDRLAPDGCIGAPHLPACLTTGRVTAAGCCDGEPASA